jgi:hypothetical protein
VITAAKTAAATAAETASDAIAAAATAQSDATEANDAAIIAQQVATSKWAIVPSPTPPPGDPKTLWLGTGNVPHLWNESTETWDVATDQTAVDAAEAAADALAAAATAQDDATEAQNMAEGRFIDSLDAPTEATPGRTEGDRWFQHEGTLDGKVIGIWTWTAGAWVNMLMDADAMLAAGSLTAASGIIGSLDADVINNGRLNTDLVAVGGAEGQPRVELVGDGIYQRDAAGNDVSHWTPDGLSLPQGSLSAQSLDIVQMDNRIPNAFFWKGLDGWTLPSDATWLEDGGYGGPAVQFHIPAGVLIYTPAWRVNTDDMYLLWYQLQVINDNTATVSPLAKVSWYDSEGDLIQTDNLDYEGALGTPGPYTADGAWHGFRGWTPPAPGGAATAKAYLDVRNAFTYSGSPDLLLNFIFAQRAAGGVIIPDRGIDGSVKLDLLSVTSTVLGTGSVTTSKLNSTIYGGDGSASTISRSDHTHTSAWSAISPAAGFSANTPAPRCRIEGDRVFLEGRFLGSIGTSAVNVGTLPSGRRPPRVILTSAMGAGVTTIRVDIATNGVISAQVASGSTGVIILDNVSFPLT